MANVLTGQSLLGLFFLLFIWNIWPTTALADNAEEDVINGMRIEQYFNGSDEIDSLSSNIDIDRGLFPIGPGTLCSVQHGIFCEVLCWCSSQPFIYPEVQCGIIPIFIPGECQGNHV